MKNNKNNNSIKKVFSNTNEFFDNEKVCEDFLVSNAITNDLFSHPIMAGPFEEVRVCEIDFYKIMENDTGNPIDGEKKKKKKKKNKKKKNDKKVKINKPKDEKEDLIIFPTKELAIPVIEVVEEVVEIVNPVEEAEFPLLQVEKHKKSEEKSDSKHPFEIYKYIQSRASFINYNETIWAYDSENGYYKYLKEEQLHTYVRRLAMERFVYSINSTKVNEIRGMIYVNAPEITDTSIDKYNYLISFNNGIYNTLDRSFINHTKDITITYKIVALLVKTLNGQ